MVEANKVGLFRNIEEAIVQGNRCLNQHDVRPEIAKANIAHAYGDLNLLKERYHLDGTISENIQGALNAIKSGLEVEVEQTSELPKVNIFRAKRCSSGRRGRPKVEIANEQLLFLLENGYSATYMAKVFGCSAKLIYKHLYEAGIHVRDKYSQISDENLHQKIGTLHKKYPNAGNEIMSGLLKAEHLTVQRQRIRSSMQRVDPVSVSQRYGRAVNRRSYSVASPNSLWHIDGHMKLIRWGITTHGGVDGFSRLVTFFMCSQDNKVITVLHKFAAACSRYGVPSRVRSDFGGENMYVGIFMHLVNGLDRSSMITGRSVHNIRIERLWKDVYTQVVHYFYQLFYAMEDNGIRQIDSPLHLYALRYVFMPVINERLEEFRNAWNKHKIRTEANKTPEQLWINGVLNSLHSPSVAISNIFADNFQHNLTDTLQHFGLTPNDLNIDSPNSNELVTGLEKEELDSEKQDFFKKLLVCIDMLQTYDIQFS